MRLYSDKIAKIHEFCVQGYELYNSKPVDKREQKMVAAFRDAVQTMGMLITAGVAITAYALFTEAPGIANRTDYSASERPAATTNGLPFNKPDCR